MKKVQKMGIVTVLAIINLFAISMAAYASNIQIEAVFNSEDGIYMHRDELRMTVKADRDCYFKVIHIDANSRMKTIYPNNSDRNNFLKANESRDIFETAQYLLYEPYGEERIIVAASIEQFPNIELEYIEPWKIATMENIMKATSPGRSRGGDLEIIGGGTAIYSISITEPSEEYEYNKPENMTETCDVIRNDILKQGGLFNGNETSGYYIVNNIRNSYRIPREAPDRVRIAVYYPNNHDVNGDIMTIKEYFEDKVTVIFTIEE